MKRLLPLVFCIAGFSANAQNPADTLTLWNYSLEAHENSTKDQKTTKGRAIGQIIFWRTKPVADSLYVTRHQENWTPMISFSIFSSTDAAFCETQSKKTKASSSCSGPDVGGDILRVGGLVLLNRDICLSCASYTTKKDYCRPVITQVLGAIDKKKVKTLADLEKQITIKKGELK